jgi:hypothetical protein
VGAANALGGSGAVTYMYVVYTIHRVRAETVNRHDLRLTSSVNSSSLFLHAQQGYMCGAYRSKVVICQRNIT